MHKGSRTASGIVRWTCRPFTNGDGTANYCYSTTNPQAIERGRRVQEPLKDFEGSYEGANKLVITWAQNATPVFKGFLASLKTYCKAERAALVVIPGRYKNPTSRWEKSQKNEQWWAPELEPFLCNQRPKLNSNLVMLGDIMTQPTAMSPLSGFESITHGESGILGHPKLQLTVIPTPQAKFPKIMATTGAVTLSNYTHTTVGKKGDFHHVFGALVIELAPNNTFHMRHLNARADGAFCDLDKAYYPDGSIKPAGPYAGLIFGDAHPPFADPGVVDATFGDGGLVERLNPKQLVFHDLLDSYAVNVHHVGNPFIAVAKRPGGYDDIKAEVEFTIDWLKKKAAGRKAMIVASNHDDMLKRWIIRQDWREDITNAEFYLETALHMVRGGKIKEYGASIPNPFRYWVEKAQLPNVTCLSSTQSHMIAGIECALHGHEGPSGARGTLKNLSNIGVKVFSGHSHTPGIERGHYKVGTMTYLHLEYTGAVGSWLNTHGSIDPMGKRHLHTCIDGSFWS